MRRRKHLPPHLASSAAGFAETLRWVEGAKDSIVEALPRARAPGRSLADALHEFEESLRQASEGMGAWRRPEVEADWRACMDGVERALTLAERLRLQAPDMAFDQLAFTIQDLIAPLDPFQAAAERFQALRR